jgi:hypothetical protein
VKVVCLEDKFAKVCLKSQNLLKKYLNIVVGNGILAVFSKTTTAYIWNAIFTVRATFHLVW